MRIISLFLAILPVIAQDAKEATAGDAQKLVKIQRIKEVAGSRFPAPSITRLAT